MPAIRTKTRKQGRAPARTQSTVYHSTQYNSTIVNGQQVATEKTVNIRNGKGSMSVKKDSRWTCSCSNNTPYCPSKGCEDFEECICTGPLPPVYQLQYTKDGEARREKKLKLIRSVHIP